MIYSQSFFLFRPIELDGQLAKVRLFCATLAGRCQYTRPVAHWLPK